MKITRTAAALLTGMLISAAVLLPTAAVSAAPDDDTPDEPGTAYSENQDEEPTYEDPEPELSYEEPEPSYEEPEPEYSYEEPEYSYEEPEPSYEEPEPSYEEPEPSYEEPEYSYEEPEYSYEEPEYSYEEPSYYYYEDSSIYGEENSSFWGTEEQSDIAEPSLTSQTSTAESSMENSVLTSEDWKELQKSMAPESGSSGGTSSKSATGSGGSSDFDKIKSDKSRMNDAWLYLAIGIPLIALGAGLIAAVVIVNKRANRQLLPDGAETDGIETDSKTPAENNTDKTETKENEYTEINPFKPSDDEKMIPSADAFRAVKEARAAKISAKAEKANELADTLEKPLIIKKETPQKDNSGE